MSSSGRIYDYATLNSTPNSSIACEPMHQVGIMNDKETQKLFSAQKMFAYK
jgi:hypothetical protein